MQGGCKAATGWVERYKNVRTSGKVQTQLGPGFQEIGGFWLNAASALTKGRAAASGWPLTLKMATDLGAGGDSARV